MKKKFILSNILCLGIVFLLSLPCHGNLVCTGEIGEKLQYPGQWFLLLVPLSLFALILKDDKYKFWLKFTGIFFAGSMFLVYLMPEYDPGLVSLDRELTNWFFAGAYSFISVIYFIVQFVKNKK